ncbi:MAG: hypothetical protein HOL01_16960 [Planctomycetaceae bacterium]|nr:hypothetical protein [Planctomycetaceae bacterium]
MGSHADEVAELQRLQEKAEELKEEAKEGTPHGLIDALKRLFHLSD